MPHFVPTRGQAEFHNEMKLRELDGPRQDFHAVDTLTDGLWSPALLKLLSQLQAPSLLQLKVGALVMLLKNVSVGQGGPDMFHGQLGLVTGMPPRSSPDTGIKVNLHGVGERVFFPEEFEVGLDDSSAKRVQYPFMLAYVLTIHKCQGMQVEQAFIDCEKAWEYGQLYTAMSRVTSLAGLHLRAFNKTRVRAHPVALQFHRGNQCQLTRHDFSYMYGVNVYK
jgi:ATP-dependent DNA helicase PIF1